MKFTRGVTFVLTGSYYPDDLHNLIEDAVGYDIDRNDLKADQRVTYVNDTLLSSPNDGEMQWQPSTKRLLLWDDDASVWLELARTDTTQAVMKGLRATYFDDHRITIEAGAASDAVEAVSMQLPIQTILDLDVFGPDGRDETTLVQDKWYYIYLIQNPETGLVATVASQNATSPDTSNVTQFPTFQPTVGTVRYRKIWAVKLENIAAKDIVPFAAREQGQEKTCFWNAHRSHYSNTGSGGVGSGSFVDLVVDAPPNAEAILSAYWAHIVSTGSGSSIPQSEVQFRPNGNTETNGSVRMFNSIGGNPSAGGVNSANFQFAILVDTASKIEWRDTTGGANESELKIGCNGWKMWF